MSVYRIEHKSIFVREVSLVAESEVVYEMWPVMVYSLYGMGEPEWRRVALFEVRGDAEAYVDTCIYALTQRYKKLGNRLIALNAEREQIDSMLAYGDPNPDWDNEFEAVSTEGRLF